MPSLDQLMSVFMTPICFWLYASDCHKILWAVAMRRMIVLDSKQCFVSGRGLVPFLTGQDSGVRILLPEIMAGDSHVYNSKQTSVMKFFSKHQWQTNGFVVVYCCLRLGIKLLCLWFDARKDL